MSALKYSYHEERGEFHGYVEDEMGNVIFEMHYPEFYEDDETGELLESSTIFEDGFMKHADDTEGLRKYLVDMRLINEDDEVIHEDDFKSQYNDGGLTSGAYGHGTTLLEEGGEMDIEEEDKEENEIEEHLQSISDDTGIPVDVLRSYADEIGTDYMDLTNDIPYNGAFGTQEDFAEYLVDNGLITDLSNYLYMTDLDIRILAGDEADARLDGMDDEDIAELAGKSDEYEELKEDLERLEELNDEIEVLESDIKEKKDAFDHENATEEERDDFDDDIQSDEEELEHAKEQKELLDNKIEWSSIEDFIDDIRDDALSNANDEITEELEKDAVGYFENLGYSQQDLANHSLFSIDYEKLAEDVSYDYIFIEGEDGDYHIFNNYADGGAIPEGYHQMPDGTIMPDSAHLEHGGGVAEGNLHMLKNQAEQFEHHANELQEALKKNPRVDAWVVAKAERAATDLSDITHYLEGLNHEHHGDGEDVIKMDVPLFIRSQEYAREDAKSDADLHEFADNAIDLSQSGETLEMDDYNKLVPNQMARGGNTNPYIDLNYKDRTQEIENLFEPTLEDIKKDPKYYAELVNDLLFHWVYGTRETPLMVHAKKSLPREMARGGVNIGASFEKFKKQVLPINIETRSEVDANTILKYADLQNVPATLKSIGDLFVVILDKPLEIRDSMEGRIKELLKGNSYAKGGKFEVDSTYTHFAVGKKDGKIVTGWEYKDLDKEDIKRFTDMDLKDMDFNPKDFRILTTRFLKSQGIDPFDWSNWKKTSEFAKGGRVLSDVDMFVEIHGYYPESVMALRGDGMGLGIIRNEAHNFELSGKDSQKAEEMGYEFDYDKKGWVEKEEDDDDFARGGETNKYEIYHETLSSALEEVEHWAKNNGYEIKGDYFPDVKVGGINYGETKRFSIPVIKEGKKNEGKIIIQIWRMDSGRYELNMYPTYAKGGATFQDKVDAIAPDFVGKEVPKRLRKDYGKKYNKKEALEAARRIAGSMRAKEMKKGKK